MEEIVGNIISVLLKTPYGFVILMFVLIIVIFVRVLKVLQANFSKRFDQVEKEILKLQILTGIDSGRFSLSELNHFADRYFSLGGNSFVEEKVEEYKEKLKENHND